MPKAKTKRTNKSISRASSRSRGESVATSSSSSPMAAMSTLPRFSSDLLERFVPVLLIVSIALSFVVGVLWQKVSYLESGAVVAGANTVAQAGVPTPPPSASLDQIKAVFDKDVLKFGDASRELLFVEVADPSCPYCHIAGGHNPELNKEVGPQFTLAADGGTYVAPVPEIKKLVDEGKASFAYVYYPGHGSGELGTKAMYCANEVGRFWDVHDRLMTSEGYDLLNDTVKNDVANAGVLANFLASAIDRNFLVECLQSGRYDQRLASDMVLARELYIQGTPGFYVNENIFAGAYSFTDMQSAIDAAL